MSKLKVLGVTKDTKIYDVTNIDFSIGVYESDFKYVKYSGCGEKILNAAKITLWGWAPYNDEKQYIRIVFELPTELGDAEDINEMLLEAVGTNNEHENVVAFHPEFWSYRIGEIVKEIYNNVNAPRIEESQYEDLKLNNFGTSWIGRFALTTTNNSYSAKNAWKDELDYIDNIFLDVEEKLVYIRTKTCSEWKLANINHEALYNYYVKNPDLAEIVRLALPKLDMKKVDLLKKD